MMLPSIRVGMNRFVLPVVVIRYRHQFSNVTESCEIGDIFLSANTAIVNLVIATELNLFNLPVVATMWTQHATSLPNHVFEVPTPTLYDFVLPLGISVRKSSPFALSMVDILIVSSSKKVQTVCLYSASCMEYPVIEAVSCGVDVFDGG